MSCLIVIPARWGSTRLPGKPLIPIAGQTLLARVVDNARRATRDIPEATIVVATDDQRIESEARRLGVEAAMTEASLTSGTARTLTAARMRRTMPTHVVNVQGDAPFLPPAALSAVIGRLAAGAQVATPVIRLSWPQLDALRRHKRDTPFSGTTCVVGACGRALWFSKQILPALRDEAQLRLAAPLSPVHRHLGLYGYTLAALEWFDAAAPSVIERHEGLEQLRFFELGIDIETVAVETPAIAMNGIDTQADVALAERLLAEHGDPFGT